MLSVQPMRQRLGASCGKQDEWALDLQVEGWCVGNVGKYMIPYQRACQKGPAN